MAVGEEGVVGGWVNLKSWPIFELLMPLLETRGVASGGD
jgi:hypothetical protein